MLGDTASGRHRWGCGVIGTKTVRRAMAVVAAAAVLALPMGLAPAQAEPDYPPSFTKISAEAYQARVGQKVKITAQTFKSGSPVTVDVAVEGDSVGSGNATANRKGIASTSVTFKVAGVNRVTMAGTGADGDPLSLSTNITVTEKSDAVTDPDDNGSGGGDQGSASGSDAGGVPFLGGGLPRTGGEIAATALIAAALVGLGALLVIFTRRRRTS